MSFSLDTNQQGKVILVTAGAAGIGRVIAETFSAAGANVHICDINPDKVAEFVASREGITGSVADVANAEAVSAMFDDLKSHHGRLDVLVNNAGTNIPEHFTKVQKKNMEYIVKLNTIANFYVAQLCSLKMLKAKNRKKIGGSIINMSSQMGHVGGPIRSVYNMTKFSLEGLTKGMAIDLAKNNIRVNTVCPTFVVTPMTKKFLKNKKFKNDMLKNIPLGRFADVSDVATAVTFLASDASSMITGTSILIDGGWTAQ